MIPAFAAWATIMPTASFKLWHIEWRNMPPFSAMCADLAPVYSERQYRLRGANGHPAVMIIAGCQLRECQDE